MTAAQTTAAPTSAINLYGSRQHGFGTCAETTSHETIWDFEPDGPMPHSTATEAIWAAADALIERGCSGTVAIHRDQCGVGVMALAPLAMMPYFGDLRFDTGAQVEIPADAINAAAV